MNSNKKRGLAVLLTLIVVTLLIYSGSVKAITIGISDLVSSITGTNTVSFLAKVDLHTNDVILSSANFTVTMTGGSENYTCVFDINGNNLSACPNISVTLQGNNTGARSLGGSLYGYGFDGSEYNTTRTNFTSAGGYGYAYNTGYGYDTYNETIYSTAELIFNITWTTPNVEANTTYTVDFTVRVTDGTNTVRYVTLDTNKGTIVIVSAEQGATDTATVTAVKTDLKYALILMDDNAETIGIRYKVISDLYLPTSMGGVTISWSSSNTSIINNTGSVTRPAANTSVDLTATLTKGSATQIKQFDLTVKKAVTVQVPDSNGTINVSGTEVKFNLTSMASAKKIKASKALAQDKVVSMDFSDLMNQTTKKLTLGANNLTLQRETSTVNYTAEIRNGTVISDGANWNGIINLPSVKTNSLYTAPSGSANIVIDMGSGVELNFSNPVKITLAGMAGKSASWTRGNTTLRTISTQCNSATNPTNINAITPRECYIDSGSDLIIWTYHFTVFAAYTPATTTTTTTGYSSGTQWDCDEWSACVNGYKSRDCTAGDKEKTVKVLCDEEATEITGDVVAEPQEEDIVVTPITPTEEAKPLGEGSYIGEMKLYNNANWKWSGTEWVKEGTAGYNDISQEREQLFGGLDKIWLYVFIGLVVVAIIILLVELKRNKGIKF